MVALTDIQRLENEHASFINKAQETHNRTEPVRQAARANATSAQEKETAAAGFESQVVAERDLSQAALAAANTDQQAFTPIFRATAAAVREANEARRETQVALKRTQDLAAGKSDRYSHWLLNTPVANGTLKLDFANQVYQVWEAGQVKTKPFHEIVNFTRASTKWVWNSTGTLVEVPVDQPAYDHDPLTGEALGVLIEPGATNEFAWSEDFTKWGSVNGAIATSANIATPTGATGGFHIAEGDSTNSALMRLNAGITSGTTYTLSAFAKADGSGRYLRLAYQDASLSGKAVFDLDAGLIVSNSGDAGIKAAGGGWYRCWWTQTASGDRNYGAYVGVDNPTGDGASGVYVFAAQFEAGSTPTSYIPTAGAAVTRAADDVSIHLSNFWSDQSFSLNIETSVTYPDEKAGTISLVAGVDWVSFMARRGTGDIEVYDGNPIYIDGDPIFQGVIFKAASSYSSNGKIVAKNGKSAATDIIAPLDSRRSQLNRSGTDMTIRPQQRVKALRVYPYAMPASELEALTTL